MLLPNLQWVIDGIGISYLDILFTRRPEHIGKGEVSRKTIQNWLNGKNSPSLSAVERFLDMMASRFELEKSNIPKMEDIALAQDKGSFGGPWYSVCEGAEVHSDVRLEFVEIRRLVDASYKIKPYFDERDPKGLAKAIQDIDLPVTDLTREAVVRLETMKNIIPRAMEQTFTPIILTNLLYLLACRDVGIDAFHRVLPEFSNDQYKLPITRWIDGIKVESGCSNDNELGALFFPQQTPASRIREMKKWRSGKLPSWKTILRIAKRRKSEAEEPDNSQKITDFLTGYAIVRLLHRLNDCAVELEKVEKNFSRRSFFETFSELRQFAEYREQMRVLSKSVSTGHDV